ncbi:MAG: hypothetical protein STSR0003_21910 [Smithella sp.]|jgi:hypothetical protein
MLPMGRNLKYHEARDTNDEILIQGVGKMSGIKSNVDEFKKLANNPEYLKTHLFREEGVERAVLYATDPIKFRDIDK